jgi:hypothetical protein
MSTIGTTTTSGPAAAADAAKGAASDVASEVTSAAADVKETAKTEVRSVVSDATERAGQVMQTTRSELRSQVADKTRSVASSLDSVAQQLTSMAEKADDPESPVTQLAKTAADQIRHQSQRLEQGGVEGLIEDARRFARNRPGAFVLGSVAAGLLFGRLAKHADLKQAVTSAKEELTGSGQQGTGRSAGSDSTVAPPTPVMSGTGSAPSGAGSPGGTVLVEADPGTFPVGDRDRGGQQ